MKVKLLQHTNLNILVQAIRICHDSFDNSDSTATGVGEKDLQLIRKVIQSGHESTLEHLVYTFLISDISRGCLQELVRHRIASYSVQSTRYTLKKLLKKDRPLADFLVLTGHDSVDNVAIGQLDAIQYQLLDLQLPNDVLKYALPEAFKTSLIMTINVRSFRNFLKLRLSKQAHFEIRKLAGHLLNKIPVSHAVLFEDIVNESSEQIL